MPRLRVRNGKLLADSVKLELLAGLRDYLCLPRFDKASHLFGEAHSSFRSRRTAQCHGSVEGFGRRGETGVMVPSCPPLHEQNNARCSRRM